MHNAMAEDMYKSQAEALAPGGNLSPEGAAELKEMAEKMGIQVRRAPFLGTPPRGATHTDDVLLSPGALKRKKLCLLLVRWVPQPQLALTVVWLCDARRSCCNPKS